MSEAPGHYRISAEATTTEPAGFESAAALTARAEKAEARVKELLDELAEQEVAKLDLVLENQALGNQFFIALDCLAGMWNLYRFPATGKYLSRSPGFMSAAENTEEMLAGWGLLRDNETAINFDTDWEELPENIKALRFDD